MRALSPSYHSLKEWLEDGNHVYVGRANPYVPGATQSEWANPFPVKKFGRDGCIAEFERVLREQLAVDGDKRARLLALRGKTLGCWCKPEHCHGDVLAKVIEELAAAPKAP